MKPNTLNITLPEDIARVKAFGDFNLAKSMIQTRLQKDIPDQLKERLLYELEVLDRISEDFIYTKEQAIDILRNNIRNFKEEEFEELFNEGAFEFYYIQGEMRFNCRFLQNLTKTRKAYHDRDINVQPKSPYLDLAINEMKEKGIVKTRFTCRTTLKLNEQCLKKGQKLKVWLPVPMNIDQSSEVKILNTSAGLVSINDESYPARTAYFEASNQTNFFVEYSFINTSVYHNLNDDEVLPYNQDFTEYLSEQKPHIIFSDYLKNLVSSIIKDETNPLIKARLIYQYITSHIMYSFMRPYMTLPVISEYVTTSLKGDCGVQALLFITMCRIAGVPAKWQSGLFIDEDGSNGCHDWAMFYIEPYGWLFADCSFGGGAHRFGYTDREEFYFGNLEPYRIVQATAFQYDLLPEPTFTRKDPYDNQRGEIEYENQMVGPDDYEVVSKIIKIEKL